MRHGKRRTWDELEQAVHRQTSEAHGSEMTLAARLLDHLSDGVRRASEDLARAIQASEKDAVRELVLLITAGACNSLNLAFDLSFRGYCAQAQSLTRNAYEYWLAGAYVHLMPGSAAELQEKSSPWPKPRTMRSKVAEKIAQDSTEAQRFQDAFGKMYKRLSQLTHPSFDSVSSVLDHRGSLHIGPFFSANRLLICCDDAYRTATLLLRLLEKVFPALQGTAWSHRNDELAQEVSAWKERATPETGA